MQKKNEALWQDVLQRLTRIEENTKALDKTADIAREAHFKSKRNEATLREMKDTQKWLSRSIVVLFIAYAVKFIFGV